MPGWMKLKLESRWPGEISTTLDRQMRYSFPGSSAGKESACNAGDPVSIPRLGRSPGERIGYPLKYSWDSLVAQKVKNSPAIWETWVQSVVGKIPWRRAWQPIPVFLLREPPWKEKPGYSPWDRKESNMMEQLNTQA